jgi:hypothetical protein
MKSLYAVIFAAAALFCAKPALAANDQLDVSELTCEQFNNYDDNNKGLIMMGFEGYYTEEDVDAVIDFGKISRSQAEGPGFGRRRHGRLAPALGFFKSRHDMRA